MQLNNELKKESLPPELLEKLDTIVGSSKIVLFMKGNREMPQCGFSDAVVKTLNALGQDYHTVDILQDPDIRQGMKFYSEWPTFPQLYIDKEFVGGCDIVVEMFQNGELEKLVK